MSNKTQQADKDDNKADNVSEIHKNYHIARGDINTMIHAHNVWAVEIDNDMEIKDLENPETWGLAAQKGMKVYDRVEVLTKNGSQLSLGIVTYVRGGDIRVNIYEQYELHKQKQTELTYEGFSIRYMNHRDQWCIFAPKTGELLKSNQPTDQAAMKYLKDHLKALGVG